MSYDIPNLEKLKNGNLKERLKYDVIFNKFVKACILTESKISSSAKYNVYFPFAPNKWFFEANGFENPCYNAAKKQSMFDITSSINNFDLAKVALGVVLVQYFPTIFVVCAFISLLISMFIPKIIVNKYLKLNTFIDELYINHNGDMENYLFSNSRNELDKDKKTLVLNFLSIAFPSIAKYKTKGFYLFSIIAVAVPSIILLNKGFTVLLGIYLIITLIKYIINRLTISTLTEKYRELSLDITDYFINKGFDEDNEPIVIVNLHLHTINGTTHTKEKDKLFPQSN